MVTPFGFPMETDAQPAADPPKDRKTYNGIEHFPNMQMGLAHYRTLDAGIGRWLQVDPEAELFYSMSPYCSMGNNPILYDDPNGDAIPIIFLQERQLLEVGKIFMQIGIKLLRILGAQ